MSWPSFYGYIYTPIGLRQREVKDETGKKTFSTTVHLPAGGHLLDIERRVNPDGSISKTVSPTLLFSFCFKSVNYSSLYRDLFVIRRSIDSSMHFTFNSRFVLASRPQNMIALFKNNNITLLSWQPSLLLYNLNYMLIT